MKRILPILLSTLTLSTCFCLSVRAQSILFSVPNGPIYSWDPASGSCAPTPINSPANCLVLPNVVYLSLALFKDTVYFNTADGHLCRYVLGDTSSCTTLSANVYTIALTVDDSGMLYWPFWNDFEEDLMKFDPHILQLYDLGTLNFYPSGDMLFYEKNLIMAGTGEQLINVNINDPEKSKVYMATPGYTFYGLANNSLNCSQRTILGFCDTAGGTAVVQIDMDKKMIIGDLCQLPIYVQDAGSAGESGRYGVSVVAPVADTFQCGNNPVVLNAGYPGASYLWDDNSTAQTRTVGQPGQYQVTVNADGCVVSDTINCTAASLPVASFPADTALCPSSSLVLDAGFPNTTYVWQDNSTGPSYTVTRPGLYSVNARDECGTVVESAEVQYIGLSEPVFSTKDTSLCTGATLVLDAANPGSSYLWDDNSSGRTRKVDVTGKYWVLVNDSGCIATDTIVCAFVPPPMVRLPKDTLLCSTDSLVLDAGFPNSSYIWQDGSTQPILAVTQTGVYLVKVTDGCASVTDSATVRFEDCSCTFYMPNAFTPDQGGANSLFQPRYRCTLNYTVEKYEMKLYNRWGQLVFGTSDIAAGWDGKYKRAAQPAGTYVWELVYQDTQASQPIRKKGVVLLIR
jgi:gliding motility-associated-like protein